MMARNPIAALALVTALVSGCQTPSSPTRKAGPGFYKRSAAKNPLRRPPSDEIYKAHDPKNRALASELIKLKRIDTKVKDNLDQRFADVVAHLPAEQRTRFFDALRKRVNIRSIRTEIIDIYTESLDRDQLTKLVVFYRSELGQFITNTEPQLNASIFESLSSSSTQEAERILLEMISEKNQPQYEEAKAPIRKALDKLLFAH